MALLLTRLLVACTERESGSHHVREACFRNEEFALLARKLVPQAAPWLCGWELYLALHDLPVPWSTAVHPAPRSPSSNNSMQVIATVVLPNRTADIDAGGSGHRSLVQLVWGLARNVVLQRDRDEPASK